MVCDSSTCGGSKKMCWGDVCYCTETFKPVNSDGSCGEAKSEILGAFVIPPSSSSNVTENVTIEKGSESEGNKTDVFYIHHVPSPPESHEIPEETNRTIDIDTTNQTSPQTARPSSFTIANLAPSSKLLETSNPITIVAPVAVVAGLLLFGIFFLLLIRKRKTAQASQQGSPVTWMRRQNGFTVIDNMETFQKNPNYYSSSPGTKHRSLFKDKEVPLSQIKLLEIIGEGAFGQVYKGELMQDDVEEPKIVAVKLLKEGLSREIKEDFEREVDIMSSFEHGNILKLLGVVTKDNVDNPYMIFEYMKHGDLAALLRKNDPIMRTEYDEVLLNKTYLIDISIQLADGMAYLASQHFVHRDLATRNCLVGDQLVVKISDFGMSRDIYTSDYYRVGGSRMLPVRWMAPECIRYGRFTTESDIWAFGVVLWEVFSFGKQPYYGHSNEEVVTIINEGAVLQRPPDVSQTIYTIMLSCWRENPNSRLSFPEIHKHLVEYNKSVLRTIHRTSLEENAALLGDENANSEVAITVEDVEV